MRRSIALVGLRAVLFAGFIVITGCAASLPAAPPQEEPLEQANKIIVQTDDDPEEAYRRVAQVLARRGFVIANSDPSLLTISTEPKDVGAGSTMRVSTFVLDGESETSIELRGQFWMRGLNSSETADPVSNQGMGGSPAKSTWQELEAIATSYPGAQVLYARDAN